MRWNSSRCDESRRVERRNDRPRRPIPSAPRGRACRSATSATCNKPDESLSEVLATWGVNSSEDFEGLLKLSADNRLRYTLADGTRQLFRWVNDLDYQDDAGRWHRVNALLLEETSGQEKHTFAWLTDLALRQNTVAAVATHGGRIRSKIENQGFNIQKNSGLDLEHAYSTAPDVLKAFYYLLQIAHRFLQMFEMGSLLQHLAKEYATTPLQLFGSLKNLNQRLLECLRYFKLDDLAFSTTAYQIRLLVAKRR